MTDFSSPKASDPAAKPETSNPAQNVGEKLASETAQRARIPMSVPRQKLSAPEIPGMHSHWMNDDEGRIQQAIEGGYTFVAPDEIVVNSFTPSEDGVGTGTDMGTRVSMAVGSRKDGSPMRAYLMKIPKEFFSQDQAIVQGRVDGIHEAMRQGKLPQDGKDAREHRYVQRAVMKSTYSRAG